MFILPGAGLCGGRDAGNPTGMSQPIPDKVSGTCRTIAAILAVYPALEVRKSEEPVRDVQGIPERHGCRIIAFGPTSGIAGETDPAEAVKRLLQGTGWTEEIRYAADGPGTTSFAFRKCGMLCWVSGGAHSWIEDGKPFSSDKYELEAGCGPEPDGNAPDLPR
jgi:hypothetical protein